MNVNHYTYRVTWPAEDSEHMGLCAEFLPCPGSRPVLKKPSLASVGLWRRWSMT